MITFWKEFIDSVRAHRHRGNTAAAIGDFALFIVIILFISFALFSITLGLHALYVNAYPVFLGIVWLVAFIAALFTVVWYASNPER